MKRKNIILLVIAMLMTTILHAAESGSCGKNVNWSLDPSVGELVISGTGAMNNYDLNTGNPSPWRKADVKSIIVEEGVTEIGTYAFYYCVNLTNVSLPNSLTKIGAFSFTGCNALTDIEIPSNVTTIGHSAFCYCRNLQYLYVQSPKVEVAGFAFGYCERLYKVTFAGTRNSINHTAFPSRTKIKTLNNNYDSYTPADDSSPALLVIVPNSARFEDPSGNNAIDGNERCAVTFQVKNEGKGVARNCTAKIQIAGTTNGISAQNKRLPNIAPGQVQEVTFPITASHLVKDGKATLTMQVDEPKGFGTDPIELSVQTRAFSAPYLQIVDYAVTGTSGSKLAKKKPFNLQLMLQNTKHGKAEDVKVDIVLPENVVLIEGNKHNAFGAIKGGEAKSLEYELVVNNNYSSSTIPVQVNIKEKYGSYSQNRTIDLQLNQTLASTKLNIEAIADDSDLGEIQLATIGSAVDKNIPVSKQQNNKTFVVIIANENYQQVVKVPFALNDGNVFMQYCEKTLGIPTQNIHIATDATINNIKQQVNWLSQVIKAYNGDARVIFYYAGHGVPDERSKTAFLLPVDGNGSDITTGYKLDDLYSTLGSLPTKSITIFLDACFSGSKREEGMLASARGVAIKVNKGQPTGNMVVFSAATGDETAYPNNQEGHGMFTYYLLKKNQETNGDVTYEELGNYIKQNVAQQSIVLNGKSQTPTIIASPAVTDWQSWKLK